LKHRSELTALGIPADITASDDRWRYTLLHGSDIESGWHYSLLSDDAASKLLAFLQPLFPNPAGIWLVEDLQRRVGMRG
jgi:hypothetical protein